MILSRTSRGSANLAAFIGQRLRTADKDADSKGRDKAVGEAEDRFISFVGQAPHTAQRAALESTARFVVGAAGLQGGKTSSFAWLFWQRLLRDGKPGREFWMIAPDSIVGATMRERFVEMAPPGAIATPKESSDRTMVWRLSNGAKVKFRSGENPKKLVAATLHGIWMDEFPLCKPEVWGKRLRARLTATGGWAIFSGSPEGRNWAHEEIWRLTQKGDDLYDPEWAGFLWKTEDNPAVSKEEMASLRKKMPPSFYRRMYEASWEAFFGQIFESWDPDRHVFRPGMLGAQPGEAFGGLDWGFAKPGAAVVLRTRRDGLLEVVEERHEANRPPSWWEEQVKILKVKHGAKRWWCDPSDPGRITDMRSHAGVDAKASNNDVNLGIKVLAFLFGSEEVRVSSVCHNLIRELSGYRWAEDSKGRPIEEPVKENDHAVDAFRYAIIGERGARGTSGIPAQRLTVGAVQNAGRK